MGPQNSSGQPNLDNGARRLDATIKATMGRARRPSGARNLRIDLRGQLLIWWEHCHHEAATPQAAVIRQLPRKQ